MFPELSSRAGEVLAAVHGNPGLTRAELAAHLDISSGLASDLVARLQQAHWLDEGPARASGRRGRPTRSLWPHPDGPLVAVAAISHESWHVAVFELGGRSIAKTTDAHDGNATRTLTAVAATLTTAWRAHPHRLRAIAVAISGTVSGARLVQAPSLGWEDLDLSVLRPSDADRLAVFVGNDATFSAVGEHAQGAARGHTSALVLFIDAGIGGALIDGGRLITGAAGMSGEFGHMPFGSPRRQCRCGARGCWNAELDGAALARRLGHPTPTDEVSFSRKVIAAARHAAGAERRAAAATARALAKGTAGLVNACDPEIVVLCGLGAELLKLVPDTIDRVYREGLMATRRAAPPPLTPGTLGDRAPLIGAMEAAFAPLLAYPDSVAGDAREPTCSAATRNT